MINGDPLTALKGFNEDVTLVGWGKQNTAPSAYGEPHAMESATELNEYYTTGDGYFNYSMESATMLDHTYDQPATKPFNGRGIPSDLPTASSVGGVKHKIS